MIRALRFLTMLQKTSVTCNYVCLYSSMFKVICTRYFNEKVHCLLASLETLQKIGRHTHTNTRKHEQTSAQANLHGQMCLKLMISMSADKQLRQLLGIYRQRVDGSGTSFEIHIEPSKMLLIQVLLKKMTSVNLCE